MELKLTEEDGQVALREHIVQKANDARLRHGMYIDSDAIMRMLDDRALVRYPVFIRFDAEALEPGEFAWASRMEDQPDAGFCLYLHPWFENQPATWPLLIAYHLPSISYGEIVEHEDAEAFGAALLGLEVEEYYRALCELVDSIPMDMEH